MIWLALLAFWLYRFSRRPHRNGDLFKGFMVGYLGFRLLIDFIKPGGALAGLTGIQWACVAMLIYYAADLPYLLRWRKAEESLTVSPSESKLRHELQSCAMDPHQSSPDSAPPPSKRDGVWQGIGLTLLLHLLQLPLLIFDHPGLCFSASPSYFISCQR